MSPDISNRKYYAKEVSYEQISDKQCCYKCKGVIRGMKWWENTQAAYHYKNAVFCGSCLYRSRYPVKSGDGSTYYLAAPNRVGLED